MYYKASREEAAFPAQHYVNRNGVLTGATVTLEIRDASSDDSYLDFSDDTFKTSGWTTKSLSVPEVVAGLYVVDGGVDINAVTLPASDYLAFEYKTVISGLSTLVADIVYLEQNLDQLSPENVRIRLAFADSQISTGGRFVPTSAISHIEMYVRKVGGTFPSVGSPSWYEVLSYLPGSTSSSSSASSDVNATEPSEVSFTKVAFPT